MSGGHYDYAFGKVDDFADSMQARTLLRKAFKKHLFDVAKAMHDIEWVDSADWAPGDEDSAIRLCLAKSAELDQAVCDAEEALATLSLALAEAKKP